MPPTPTSRVEALKRMRSELQRLHNAAGGPTSMELKQRIQAQWSDKTVREIIRCEPFPDLDQLLEVVKALGGEADRFRKLWNDAADIRGDGPVDVGTCRAEIQAPRAGDLVGDRVEVRGVVTDLPRGGRLWIVHRTDPRGPFWPKEPEIFPEPDGSFEVHVYEGGAGGTVNLSLVLTTDEGSAEFDAWMAEGSRTGHYPGLKAVPGRDVELATVSVAHRKAGS